MRNPLDSMTMTNSEFKEKLSDQIHVLQRHEVIEFALDICERLMPEYVNFHHKHKWGDLSSLQQSINFCHQHKLSGKIETSALDKLKQNVNSAIPDTEEFGDYDGSYALNAAASIAELLDYFTDKDLKHILNISDYMTDTIDFKIHEKESNLTLDQLEQHPMNIIERNHQLKLVKYNVI
jgi:uncharacterized protein YjaG (DUF416 family)